MASSGSRKGLLDLPNEIVLQILVFLLSILPPAEVATCVTASKILMSPHLPKEEGFLVKRTSACKGACVQILRASKTLRLLGENVLYGSNFFTWQFGRVLPPGRRAFSCIAWPRTSALKHLYICDFRDTQKKERTPLSEALESKLPVRLDLRGLRSLFVDQKWPSKLWKSANTAESGLFHHGDLDRELLGKYQDYCDAHDDTKASDTFAMLLDQCLRKELSELVRIIGGANLNLPHIYEFPHSPLWYCTTVLYFRKAALQVKDFAQKQKTVQEQCVRQRLTSGEDVVRSFVLIDFRSTIIDRRR